MTYSIYDAYLDNYYQNQQEYNSRKNGAGQSYGYAENYGNYGYLYGDYNEDGNNSAYGVNKYNKINTDATLTYDYYKKGVNDALLISLLVAVIFCLCFILLMLVMML